MLSTVLRSLLFVVKLMKENAGQYRLEVEKVIPKQSSMEVIWRLADYDCLRIAPRFPGILSAAATAASRRVGFS
jgi:hypothetical protein